MGLKAERVVDGEFGGGCCAGECACGEWSFDDTAAVDDDCEFVCGNECVPDYDGQSESTDISTIGSAMRRE